MTSSWERGVFSLVDQFSMGRPRAGVVWELTVRAESRATGFIIMFMSVCIYCILVMCLCAYLYRHKTGNACVCVCVKTDVCVYISVYVDL